MRSKLWNLLLLCSLVLCTNVSAGGKNTCTAETLLAASDKDVSNVIKQDISLQRAWFCSSSWEQYSGSSGAQAEGSYGIIYGSGSYTQNEWQNKRAEVCSDKTADAYKKELEDRLKTSLSFEKMRLLCGAQKFVCTFEADSLQLVLHYTEPNTTERARFARDPIAQGSLSVVDKSVKKGAKLLRTGDAGRIIPLTLVKGKELQSGLVLVEVEFGNGQEYGLTESCLAYRPKVEVPRQMVYTAGASDSDGAIFVRPTFSRIRNTPEDRKEEYFTFTVPSDGKLNVKLYAKDEELILRLVTSPGNRPAPGNQTHVKPGTAEVFDMNARANTTYIVGIQAGSGGPTGTQLDVSFDPN